MSEFIRVDNRLFVGRIEEQKQFRAALQDVLRQPSDEELPYICLLHGDGGMGKTTLIRRFRDIAMTEKPFAGNFQVLWIDWEDERKKSPSLQVGRGQISEETVFRTLHAAARQQKWGRQFVAYNKALQQRDVAAKRVAEVLAGDNKSWDEEDMVRTLGVDALAKIIRMRLPMIGDAGEELVETFLETGVKIGAEQAVKLRMALENHLRAALDARHFNYFLNPQEQLALAIARGLNRVARKQYLLVVLDGYELIDRADIWMRVVQRGAGARVVWIISDRHNLLQSRQFGRDYFKGYADDFPRRLLGYQMRPLAIPHIHTYFRARVPDRPLSMEETEAISRVTRGIPLAVREAAEIWEAGASLHEIVGDITGSTPGSQIVKKMTDRYLQHVVLEADRQALFALALAEGDVEILRSILQPADESEGELDLEGLLRRLERDYASVHASRARLHDDPALFFREYLKEPLRRTSKRIRRLNERALAVLHERLETLEAELEGVDERCRDDNWVQAVLSLTRRLFWLEETEAWQWLIPRFVEGMGYNRDLQNGLIHVVDEWQGHLSESGEEFLQILRRSNGQQEEHLLNLLQQLRRRGWLAGPGEKEREAILDMQIAAQHARAGQVEEALARYHQVEASLEKDQEALRRQLAGAYETLARRSLSPESAMTLPPATAVQLLGRIANWFPEQPSTWQLLGLVHATAGERERAIAAFRRAVDLAQPDDAPYRSASRWLGDLYRETGRLKEAEAAYKAVLDEEPATVEARIGLGEIYLAQGKIKQAEKAFKKAMAGRSPEEAHLDALLGLARIHLRAQRDKQAHDLFLHVLARDPRRVEAARGMGEAAYRLGEIQSALANFREATLLDPRDAATRCSLAQVYHRGLGQPRPALVAYERALAAADESTPLEVRIEAHVGLGDIHYEAHRYPLALTAYRRTLALDPDLIEAHEGLARVYRALGRYEDALQAHQAALETAEKRDRPYAFAYDNLGDVHLALGHFEEAAKAYEDALRLDLPGAHIYVGLGDARLALGEAEAAGDAYSQALVTEPRSEEIHAAALRGQGDVLAANGRLDEAIDLYEEALSLVPDDGHAYLRLGQARARQEEPKHQEAAELAFRQAISLNPDDARPHADLGALYYRRGELGAARNAYQRALALDPSLAAAYVGLGELLVWAGHVDNATAAFRQALEVEGGKGMHPPAVAQTRAKAHRHLGDILRKQAHHAPALEAPAIWRQALSAYKQASALNPESGPALIGLGKVHWALGRTTEAERAYRRALALPGIGATRAALAHYGLGGIYQTQKNTDAAESALREAARLRPAWNAPQVGLGLLYASQEQPERAITVLEKALRPAAEVEEKLDLAVPLCVLGDQHLLLDHFEEALQAYKRALAIASGRLRPVRAARVHLGIGEAQRALGDTTAAESAYRQALTAARALEKGDRIRLHLGLAAVYLAGSKYGEVITACEQVIELAPEGNEAARTYRYLGDALTGRHAYAAAADAYRQSLEYDSPPAMRAITHQGLARTAYALGDYREALATHRQAQELLPDLAADPLLGQIYLALGEEGLAETAYQAALDVDPRDALSLTGLGTICYRRGEQEKALPYFQQAVRLRPRMAAPYVGMGQVHLALGKSDLAAAASRKALQVPEATAADRAKAHTLLGDLQAAAGAYRQAGRAYQRALAAADADYLRHDAAMGLGEIYLALEAWEEATDAFQQAIGTAPADRERAAALLGLGRAQAMPGRHAVAASTFERARALDAEAPAIPFWLGKSYAALGRHEEALQAFDHSLTVGPEVDETRPDLFLHQGRSALALRQIPAAVDAYKAALALSKGAPGAAQISLYLFGGDLWLAAERYDDARAAYEKVLGPAGNEDDKARAQAALGLGHVFRALGSYRKALAAYNQALSLQPEYAAAYAGLGATYNCLEDATAAVSAYERARDLATESVPFSAVDYVGLADAYAQLGQRAEARTAYERALARDGQLLPAYRQLGQLLLEDGESQQALTCFKSAAHLNPERAEVQEALGRVYLELEQYPQAEAAFRRALDLAPGSGTAHAGLGHVHRHLRRWEEAMQAYKEAYDLGVDDADLHQALATLHIRREDPQAALEALESALAAGGDKAAIYAYTGAVHEMMGDDQEAFNYYQQAQALDEQAGLAYIGMGNVYLRREHHYDAMVSYRRALDITPDSADAYYGIAQVYSQMGRTGDAQTHAERAVEYADEPGPILLFLAAVYRRQGASEAALEAYAQVLAQEPAESASRQAEAHSGQGTIYLEQANWGDAEAAFRKALALVPDCVAAIAGLGEIRVAEGRLEDAQTAYEQALALDPDRARTHAGLGNLYVAQGEPHAALAVYQQALTLDKRDPVVRTGFGNAFRALQRTDEALAAYARAISLNPRLIAPYMGQGDIYRDLNLAPQALKSYKKAISLQPHLPAYLAIGEIFLNWGHLSEALAAYENAVTLAEEKAPESIAAALLGLGNVYRDQEAYDKAIAAYKRAWSNSGAHEEGAEIQANLGDVYNTLGRTEDALAAYRRAVQLCPDDALSYGSLAGLFRKLGRPEEYRKALARARKLMADESEYNRACLEAIAGEVEEAVSLLQMALQKRQVELSWVRQDRDFDFIRDEPAFQALLRGWSSGGVGPQNGAAPPG